jgi:predicted membrane protein
MIKVGAAAFVIIAAAITMLYFGHFRFIQNFDARYGLYTIYTIVAAVVIGMGIWHVKSYRHTFNCSMGMMAGMTVGMMAGFLLGAIVGATNGMFMGSVYGMVLGMFTGAWCARCCGIMSIMEGLMAGLMGGLMGAMTTVMMLNDNIVLFMPILVGSIVVIMTGMSVMIYKESSEYRNEVKKKDKYEMLSYISLIFVLAMLTMFVMLYGPKSALLAAY